MGFKRSRGTTAGASVAGATRPHSPHIRARLQVASKSGPAPLRSGRAVALRAAFAAHRDPTHGAPARIVVVPPARLPSHV